MYQYKKNMSIKEEDECIKEKKTGKGYLDS